MYRNSEWVSPSYRDEKGADVANKSRVWRSLHVACKISVEVRTAKPTEKECNSPTWNKTLKFFLLICWVLLILLLVATQILFNNRLASCTRCQLRGEILYNMYCTSRMIRSRSGEPDKICFFKTLIRWLLCSQVFDVGFKGGRETWNCSTTKPVYFTIKMFC